MTTNTIDTTRNDLITSLIAAIDAIADIGGTGIVTPYGRVWRNTGSGRGNSWGWQGDWDTVTLTRNTHDNLFANRGAFTATVTDLQHAAEKISAIAQYLVSVKFLSGAEKSIRLLRRLTRALTDQSVDLFQDIAWFRNDTVRMPFPLTTELIGFIVLDPPNEITVVWYEGDMYIWTLTETDKIKVWAKIPSSMRSEIARIMHTTPRFDKSMIG